MNKNKRYLQLELNVDLNLFAPPIVSVQILKYPESSL